MSFDHRDPGTDPAVWTTFLAGLDPDRVDLRGTGSVVVVAPHPDDETLGAGGLVATAADAGIPVHVLLGTRGERSHPDSPTTTPAALAERRGAEFRAALRVLHPTATATELDVPDGGVREHAEVLREALVRRLAGAVRPTLVVAPWRGDGHRDHRVAGEVAEQVVAATPGATLLAYPIWAWHWDAPPTDADARGADAADAAAAAAAMPWSRARALHLAAAVRDRKARALDAHRSQTRPLSPAPGDEAVVDARHAAHHLRAEEWYFAPVQSRSRESFDAHYARKPEGWDFEGSWYERRKRAMTLAALPRERFRSALELGCATGVLTTALTERADDVLGTDLAAAALERARRRAPSARFALAAFPGEWPEGRRDLVVLSEVGYYLSPDDLDRTVDRVLDTLDDDDGVLVACHWRHADDHAVSDGDTVHTAIARRWPRPALVQHVEPDFVLTVFPGAAVPSVARAEGLVG
ncbi:PIG-L family deacetylase [Curtobacterium sp. csp3]|uniref:PIG-L family deacetylase n=1 Tax=Curtobacterium sp. csp3 TaxID=2588937 RepID=UPI00211E0FDC|nr:PIG-L family deacetylase [Curtobacterium sp. csp3]